jgi:hypothetical protein
MKPRWKRAAKRAYTEAYSSEEIAESIMRACHADWRSEVLPALVGAITKIVAPSGQQPLFQDNMAQDLKKLRGLCVSPLAASFLECTIDAVGKGETGAGAVERAAQEAMTDRLLRNYRQVEEHLRRDDCNRSANFVRTRLEAAHSLLDIAGLASAAMKTGSPLSRRSRAAVSDLDAGVPL